MSQNISFPTTNISSMQQDDISPTKGRGYGDVTVLKFCR